MHTWIYLIQDKYTGYHKIGHSLNPIERCRELRKQKTLLPVPSEFVLIEAWRGDTRDERALHRIFKHNRVRGEWFSLSDSDLSALRRYFFAHTKLSTRESDKEAQENAEIEMCVHSTASWLDFSTEALEIEF